MNGTAAPLRSRKRHPGGLWVPETLFTSRDLLIFVEEAAQAVVSFDLGDVGRCAVGERPCGGCLPQRLSRSSWKLRWRSLT